MSDRQKPSPKENEIARPGQDEGANQPGDSEQSYYYDDATGYEIYREETDEHDGAEPEKED
jgi:hypothetical protein